MGEGRESTEGGGEIRGEVGRADVFLMRRLLEDFLSFDDETLIFKSGGLAGTTEGKPSDSKTDGGERRSESLKGWELEEEKDPTLWRLSNEEVAEC